MAAPLVAGVLQLAQIWLSTKAKERLSLSEARMQRLQDAAKSEDSWTSFMVGESQNGWKDEAWTLCFIFVIIACFIPSAQTYIERGFLVLDNTPEWFRWAMLTSISASFGLRGFDKFIRRKGIVK